MFEKAVASDRLAGTGLNSDDLEDCSKLDNSDISDLFRNNRELSEYNKLIQIEMDNVRNEIRKKIKDKAPNCEPDFIEVPNLFIGGRPFINDDGALELPMKMADSVLPNPTNSISVNDTVISPDPSNAAFRNYLTKEYEKRGLKHEVVDTFDYAHIGDGNLHCATNTFHICKPRGLK